MTLRLRRSRLTAGPVKRRVGIILIPGFDSGSADNLRLYGLRLMDYPIRILVIEDDLDSRANLCDILELDGHVVFTASSLNESKSISNTHKIDLVIADRRLPEGMIEEFLPQFKANLCDAEIIVVTGYADMQSTIAALRLGVSDYVIKPIFPDEIRKIVHRIAEKRSLKSQLAAEHHFADEVLKTAEAIVLVLDLDGRVIRFNPFFQQLTGWTMDDLAGKDWFAGCIPERDRGHIKSVFIATAQDTHTRGIINDVQGKDGSCHKIRWSNTTLKKEDGTIHAILAVGVDVSDLTAAQSRVLQAERLAAIGHTMTALTHESRNALQRIKAAAEVLALEIAGNESAEDDLHVIQRACGDLQYLFEEVRSFASPIQIQLNSTHLPHVWQRAWGDIAANRRGRDAELTESLTGCDPNVEVDTMRMEQVFRNLFENSLAACNDPVRIKIEFRSDEDMVELRCSDNGPGLNEEQQLRLFEPFYTTKNSGTGLGMSICQRIIEAHGGTIDVEPSECGACFVVQLPRQVRNGTLLYCEASAVD